MGKPFVFSFSRGMQRTPRVMALVDILAHCGLCGYEEIQRFYHGVPFHSLTIKRWNKLLQEAPQMLSYRCSNCATDVRPEHALRCAVSYGFADGAGLLQSFIELSEPELRPVVHALSKGVRLDVQSLPVWEAPEDSQRTQSDHLTEDWLMDELGRVMNFKGVWRGLLKDALVDGHDEMEEVASGVFLAASTNLTSLEEMIAEDETLKVWAGEKDLFVSSIMHRPENLPWLAKGRLPHGVPETWMPEDIVEVISSGGLHALVALRPSMVMKTLKTAVRRAQLEVEIEGEGADAVFAQWTTPRDTTWGGVLRVHDVLTFAAHTAISPAEAARLCAEEIIAELMGRTLQLEGMQ